MQFNIMIIMFDIAVLCIYFLNDGVIGDCPRYPDPCRRSVYTELDEPTRSTRYNVTNSNEHDYTITEAWYRSVSGAGGDMPTYPVYTGQCNAYAPIWLNDSLPSAADNITYLDACASFLYDDCVRNYIIPVKNCGTFNVYCLPRVQDAFDRYCMGSEIECNYGYTSDTGFTPGCEEIVCSSYDLTYEKRRRFVYDVTRADGNDVKFHKSFQGSSKLLRIDLQHHNSAKITLTPKTDSSIRVKRFCVDTVGVKKVIVQLFDDAGEQLLRAVGKEDCLVTEEVAGVRQIELEFKKKSSKTRIKLSDLYIDACRN